MQWSERELKKAEAREFQQQPAAQSHVIQQAPTIVYQGSTITSLQVRKEKEAELFANDQYWANRLKNQEAEFLKNSKIMEQEFSDTVRTWNVRHNSDTLIQTFVVVLGKRCEETFRDTVARQSTSTMPGLKE